MREPLFSVNLMVDGESDTGETFTTVEIVGRYRHRDGEVIGRKECESLDEAMDFARGAVTAFLEGTESS